MTAHPLMFPAFALIIILIILIIMMLLGIRGRMEKGVTTAVLAEIAKVRLAPGEFLVIMMDGETDTLRYVRQEIAKLLVIDKARVIMLPVGTEIAALSAENARPHFPNLETKTKG